MEQHQASPAAINGTGTLFDSRWPSLPGNSVAVQALVASAISFQDQAQLEQFATRSAAATLGAQSAVLVSSTAAAIALLARASSFQGGLVLSAHRHLAHPRCRGRASHSGIGQECLRRYWRGQWCYRRRLARSAYSIIAIARAHQP